MLVNDRKISLVVDGECFETANIFASETASRTRREEEIEKFNKLLNEIMLVCEREMRGDSKRIKIKETGLEGIYIVLENRLFKAIYYAPEYGLILQGFDELDCISVKSAADCEELIDYNLSGPY